MPPTTPRYFQVPVTQSSPVQKATAPVPKPRLRLHNNNLEDQGSIEFTAAFSDPREVLKSAIAQVLIILYPSFFKSGVGQEEQEPSESQLYTPWPEVRSITFVVDDGYDGVAYTTGIALDNSHKEIHLSTDYTLHQKDSGRLREEITGVVVHEMVHCWQHSCNGIPGGLIEGVADYVRLKANLSPPHWKKEHGDNWDAGYQHTAYFLEWLEERFGFGTIEKLNRRVGQLSRLGFKYEEDKFWTEQFDKKVGDLWKEYGKTFKKDDS